MGLFDRHREHFMNVLTFVANIQGFTVVAFAMANITGNVNVW